MQNMINAVMYDVGLIDLAMQLLDYNYACLSTVSVKVNLLKGFHSSYECQIVS